MSHLARYRGQAYHQTIGRNIMDFTLQDLEEMREEYLGKCTSCGYEQDCVEGDAEHYECESCGKKTVEGFIYWMYEIANSE